MTKNEETMWTLQALRLEMDALARALAPMCGRLSAQQAQLHLRLAKAHLGNVKGLLGEPSPYGGPVGTVEAIPFEDATATVLDQTDSDLARLNGVRAGIEQVLRRFVEVGQVEPPKTNQSDLLIASAAAVLTHLMDAKFCLGFVLGELRDENLLLQ